MLIDAAKIQEIHRALHEANRKVLRYKFEEEEKAGEDAELVLWLEEFGMKIYNLLQELNEL